MNGFINAFFSRPYAVLLALIIIVIFGSSSFVQMPKEATPDIDIPMAYISVGYEGITPTDAEKLLAKPLEKHLRTVAGLDKMTSASAEGYSSVTLEFDAGENIDLILDDVREAVDAAKPDLPNEADEPKIFEINISMFPILTVALSGPISYSSLVKSARELKDELESLTGVLEVDIGGDREEIIEIIIDAKIMEAYGLSPSNIIRVISSNSQLVTAGSMEQSGGNFLLKVPAVIETIDELSNMPIKADKDTSLKFSDIATIRRTFKDPEGYSRVNGDSTVVLELKKRVGSNLIEISDSAKTKINNYIQSNNQAIKVSILHDESKNVRNILSELGNNVIAAVLIVMVMILATLGFRNALLVGVAIPGSFLLGFIILNMLGITLNIIVLFSLILVAGLLVDAVIVTTEFADTRLSKGINRFQAYKDGASRMFWPITSSTATTLMVFLPLLFWPGIVGQFMKYLPITMIFVLTSSLLMALIFVPVIGSLFGKNPKKNIYTKPSAPKFYRSILKFSIKRPITIMLLIFSIIGMSFYTYSKAGLGVSFFPDIEPEKAKVQILSRGDFSSTEKDNIVQSAEKALQYPEGVDIIYARSKNPENNDPRDSIGNITTFFSDWQEREPANKIIENMRNLVKNIPGAKVNVIVDQEGPGGGKPIYIEVVGSDLKKISVTVEKILEKMTNIDGFIDVADSRPLPGTEWMVVTDRETANQYGVSVSAIGTMIKLLTKGVKLSDYRPDDIDDELEVLLRFKKSQRSLARLEELKIPSDQGEFIPMNIFAKLEPKPKNGEIQRLDGKRYMAINADVKDGLLPAKLIENLKLEIEKMSIDNDVSIEFGGEDEDIAETQAFLGQAFGLSLLLMIMILMIQFNSFWQTFVTMSAIILSIGGVLLGLWITGRPFGIVMSGLGIIALAGIVVNNNIVLIDTYNEIRKRGYAAPYAAFRAGLLRFRPVILTAITTILGLLPMVFELTIKFADREVLVGAPSSQWWAQLSSTIAGGLTFATILTLLATPALLVFGHGMHLFLKKNINKITGKSKSAFS